MEKRKYFYKIDNAGKIFPAISKNSRSNVFRLSFYLNKEVNKYVLDEAINKTLNRFEVFNIKLRNGLFWNYFSENNNIFYSEEESTIVSKYFKFNENNDFLFKVYYYKNKITLETFHALTDGTGALEFLKSIVYEYLILMGEKIEHENMILSRKTKSNNELYDPFLYNYNPKMKKKLKEEKAYHLKGETFNDDFSLVIKLNTKVDQFLNLVRNKYNSTITEYICALIAYSIYKEGVGFKKGKKPIKMFVPVNLRPYFDEISLRNFSLYIKATFNSNKDYTFDEMIDLTKNYFKEQLNKDKLHKRLNSLVSLERNIFVRFIPLFLKNFIFKIGYNMLGDSIITSSLSNLGLVKLPKEMEEFVSDIEFIGDSNGITTNVLSYKNNLNIVFTSTLKDISVIRKFIEILKEENLEITINTNYKEEYNEIL